MHQIVGYPLPSSCVQYKLSAAFKTESTCYAAFKPICETQVHQLVCYRRHSTHVQSMLRAALMHIGEPPARPLVCYRISSTCVLYILVEFIQPLCQCRHSAESSAASLRIHSCARYNAVYVHDTMQYMRCAGASLSVLPYSLFLCPV